jgi:hypothetical protein
MTNVTGVSGAEIKPQIKILYMLVTLTWVFCDSNSNPGYDWLYFVVCH